MFPSRRIATSGGDVFRNEYSLEFDGTDSYVEVADDSSLDLTTGFTISAWIKKTDIGYGWIVQKGTGNYKLDIGYSGEIRLRVWHDGGTYKELEIMSVDYSDSTWHHIIGTYTASTSLKIYGDGVLLGTNTTSIPGTLDDSSDSLFFGAYGGTSYFFEGNIDEVAIWDTALTSNQVKTLYNGREPFNAKNIALSNLKGYWRMGDGVLDHKQTDGLVADQVNATLGSEMWNNDYSSGTGNWLAKGDNTLTNPSSGIIKLEYDNDSNGMEIELSDDVGQGDLTSDLTIGQVYKWQFDAYIDGGDESVGWNILNDGWAVGIITVTSTTFTTYTYYFTAARTVPKVELTSFGAGENIYLKNFSLKEINGNAGVMVSFDGSDFKTDVPS